LLENVNKKRRRRGEGEKGGREREGKRRALPPFHRRNAV